MNDVSAGDKSGPWRVYLLNCADGTQYCGVTTDIERRLDMHNGLLAGGARYTRSRRPVRLAIVTRGFARGEALRLEARIKKLKKHEKKAELEKWRDQRSSQA